MGWMRHDGWDMMDETWWMRHDGWSKLECFRQEWFTMTRKCVEMGRLQRNDLPFLPEFSKVRALFTTSKHQINDCHHGVSSQCSVYIVFFRIQINRNVPHTTLKFHLVCPCLALMRSCFVLMRSCFVLMRPCLALMRPCIVLMRSCLALMRPCLALMFCWCWFVDVWMCICRCCVLLLFCDVFYWCILSTIRQWIGRRIETYQKSGSSE